MRTTCTTAMAAMFVAFAASATLAEKVSFAPAGIAFTPGAPVPGAIPGILEVPKSSVPVPAVVIVHSSAGLLKGGTEEDYAAALNKAGIATLVIDMWTPRSIPTGSAAYGGEGGKDLRPKAAIDTLPDAFGALKFLAARPEIDPKKIGITGFSWGAVVSFLTMAEPLSMRQVGPGLRFAAHAPHYMGCFGFLPGRPGERTIKEPWTGAPMLLLIGGKDDLDSADGGKNCRALVESLSPDKKEKFQLVVYPNATHSWDAKLPKPVTRFERFANQGRGGKVRIVPDAKVTAQARKATVEFFAKTFGM